MKTQSKIGIIGDLHFRPYLRYAEYTADRRESEREAVLNTIVSSFSDCDKVVILGDVFDTRNNPSSVIRHFTEFLERFDGKEVFILAGNHEKSADGKTALDYLREIKNHNWHVITNQVEKFGDLVFCPYFFKEELEEKDPAEATKKLMAMLPEGKIFFSHHAYSDTLTVTGQMTNLFPEVVFPKTEMEARYELVVGGHIHKPGIYGKTLVAGCVMSNEAGDVEKFVYKTDGKTFEEVPLPIRPIVRIENPTTAKLNKLKPNSIVKAVFTDKEKAPTEAIREKLRTFDAYILLEQYPNERKKMDIEGGAVVDYSIEQLLGIYAKEKNVDETKLLSAWELIK